MVVVVQLADILPLQVMQAHLEVRVIPDLRAIVDMVQLLVLVVGLGEPDPQVIPVT